MLGDMLREAREARGISLQQAERDTRIREKYIAALEDDNTAGLPSPVYARGFLRNYALYLGVDADEALHLFDVQTQPARNRIRAARGEAMPDARSRNGVEKISISPLSPEPVDTRLRYGSSYITVSLLALPLIIAFYFIYSAYAGRNHENVPIPTAQPMPPTVTALPPATLEAGLKPGSGDYNTPTVYVPATPGAPAAAPPVTATISIAGALPTTTIPAGAQVTVKVTTSRDAWMRVLVDGVQQFNGTVRSGASRTWAGKSKVRIRTGRADVVRITVNNSDRGLMGGPGNLIVEKEWTRNGAERVITK